MISVITVNYHTESYLKELLCILNQERLVQEIIVVNNSPDPLSFSLANENYGKVKLIANKKNVGLAKAVNQAARLASFSDLLLINPDVKPLEGSIATLYETAKKWSASIAGPRFYWDDGQRFRIPPAEGASLFWQNALTAAQAYPVDARLVSYYWQIRFDRFWDASDPVYEPFLGGACLLVDSKMFSRKSLFDERYFLYYEETDFCYQAIKNDLRILCVPQAEMIHYWSMSPAPSKSKADLMSDSAKIFMDKHYQGIPIPSYSQMERPLYKTEELKDLNPPIQFKIPRISDISLYLEIGANPLFVPFAQAKVSSEETFVLPDEIWLRMDPQEYYGRVRGSLSGTIKTWKFHKGS
jgi:GT2 family glycosyltransferase